MTTILIVDDTQFMRRRISQLLAQYEYDIIEAEDGEEAVLLYNQNRPDAVLMDITMPKKDGLSALTEICRFDPEAKVIMLTALGQQATALKAVQSGAKDFLLKPYNSDEVIQALKNVLGG